MSIINKKLVQNNCPVIIAQDINDSGAKQYIGLSSYYDIVPFIEKQEEKCFHEVMLGLQNRSLYFNFDLKVGEGEFPEMNEFVHHMRECIVLSVDLLFGATLDPSDIIFTESHREDKFSVHIHVPTFNTSVENLQVLFRIVNNVM